MKSVSIFICLQGLVAWAPLAEGAAPESSPPGAAPRIKGIQTKLVGSITGPMAPVNQKPWDICGTDLGIMTELNQQIFFFFGDTFGYDGDTCRGFGGPNWRSNVMAIARDVSPEHGIALERWLTNPEGKAVAVVEGAHQPAFTGTGGEQTKIPTAAVAVGTRLYLHLCRFTVLPAYRVSGNATGRNGRSRMTAARRGRKRTGFSAARIQGLIC